MAISSSEIVDAYAHLPGELLLLAYRFPPFQSMGAHRNERVYKSLFQWFERVYLITPDQGFPPSFVEEDDLKLIKTLDFRNVVRYLSLPERPGNQIRGLEGGRWLVRLKGSYPVSIWLDEGGKRYVRKAIRLARKWVEDQSIKVIYSSFGPVADLVIGLKLKQDYPHLKWVVDFRDLPLDQGLLKPLFKNAHERFMEKVLEEADVLLTVSEGLANKLNHPNQLIVRNGMNPMPEPLKKPSTNAPFILNYSGSLYNQLVDAGPVLRATRMLIEEMGLKSKEFLIRYAGNDNTYWQKLIQENKLEAYAKTFETLSHQRVIQLQQEAHANLLLSWSRPTQKGILTGKLFEYLMAGRPILGWVDGPEDEELVEIFERTKAGSLFFRTDPQSYAAFKESLGDLVQRWQKGESISLDPFRSSLRPYYWSAQFAPLYGVLRQLLTDEQPWRSITV